MSFSYLAIQCPLPIAPTTPPATSGCTDTTTTAGSYAPQKSGQAFDPLVYNQMLAQTASAFISGGGYGVLSGCVLSTASGLTLPVGSGTIACLGAIEIPVGSVVVPDNTPLVFIWALQNGTLASTSTITPPVANCVYIGNCTTSGGNITAVDYSGVCYVTGGGLLRTTNDRSAPTDTPTAGTAFLTKTGAGTYHFNGSEYSLLPGISKPAIYAATLTGDLTLIPQDNKVTFNLVASGGNRTVFLPDPSTLPSGWLCPINNVGASNSIIVKDFTGVTTYSTNTTTNRSVGAYTYTSSGSVIFPAGAWGPGSFPVPGPVVGPVS